MPCQVCRLYHCHCVAEAALIIFVHAKYADSVELIVALQIDFSEDFDIKTRFNYDELPHEN